MARERNRIKIRVRAAMTTQAQFEGRYLGVRPPYGYLLTDVGPHPNPAKAPDGKRLHALALDEPAAVVVRRPVRAHRAGYPETTEAGWCGQMSDGRARFLPLRRRATRTRPRSAMARPRWHAVSPEYQPGSGVPHCAGGHCRIRAGCLAHRRRRTWPRCCTGCTLSTQSGLQPRDIPTSMNADAACGRAKNRVTLYGRPNPAPVHKEIEPMLGNPAGVKVGGTRAETPAGCGRFLAAHVRRSSPRRRPAAQHNHRACGTPR